MSRSGKGGPATAKCIIVGNDEHDKNLLLKVAADAAPPETRSFASTAEGRRAMLAELRRRKKKAKAPRVAVACETSGAGYGLHDEVTDAGFECYALAPTLVERSHKSRRTKTDERDAEMIFYRYLRYPARLVPGVGLDKHKPLRTLVPADDRRFELSLAESVATTVFSSRRRQ